MIIQNRIKNVFAIIFIMLILLSGCISSENKLTPTPTIMATPTITAIPTITETIQPIETTGPIPTETGITHEEQLRIIPPSPRNLVGEFKINYIYLKWDIPENVTVPHNYSDIISYYKIYKGTTEKDMSYLTSTSKLEYKDFNISIDLQYVYEITAFHEGDTEGSPTQDIIVKT